MGATHWIRKIKNPFPLQFLFSCRVSFFHFYCNKLLHTSWLETTQIYCALHGLKQHKFIISQFRSSEVWNRALWAKIQVLAGLHAFWRLQRKVWFLAFPSFSELPVLLGPFLHFESQQLCHPILGLHRHISSSDPPAFLFHLLRTLMITLGPSG